MPDIMAYTMPLSGAAHNNRAFQWTPLLDKCFKSIKALAARAPILKPVDFSTMSQFGSLQMAPKQESVQYMAKGRAGNNAAQQYFYPRNS